MTAYTQNFIINWKGVVTELKDSLARDERRRTPRTRSRQTAPSGAPAAAKVSAAGRLEAALAALKSDRATFETDPASTEYVAFAAAFDASERTDAISALLHGDATLRGFLADLVRVFG